MGYPAAGRSGRLPPAGGPGSRVVGCPVLGRAPVVRLGRRRPAFPRVHGLSVWDYMSEHADFAAPFHRWMSQQFVQHNAAVVAAYDFSLRIPA